MEERLAEAVRIRLISDVPLGALLSGGTDSSIVVALMARASSKPVKTFFDRLQRLSASMKASTRKLVAQKFHTDHHELIVEPNLEATLTSLTSSLEEPFGDSSMLPTYFVSCLARQHVTVALSGDGGDELFAGYDRYAVHMKHRIFDAFPPRAGRWYREQVYPRLPFAMRGRRFSYNATLPWDERYLDSISFISGVEHYARVLSSDFQTEGRIDPWNSFRSYLQQAQAEDNLSRILYLDTKTYLARRHSDQSGSHEYGGLA